MLLALIISIALLVLLIAWQTHGSFSRKAFWLVAGTVLAINAILFAIGGGFWPIDLPGLLVVGPVYSSFEPTTPAVDFVLYVVIVMISASAWGYIAGRLAGAIVGRRRRLWIVNGSCSVCGYNLTGNTSGVCPECGTKTPTTSTASHQR